MILKCSINRSTLSQTVTWLRLISRSTSSTRAQRRPSVSICSRPTCGLALFDCGPSSCIPALKRGLADRGLELGDVKQLLLSHIHLDHAGAAGTLVREHPELQIWVSEIGAPHLMDPSRLERSARRLYGDAFDELWGELAPVPESNVRIASGRAAGLECFPSPGHASHHVCYFDGTTLYAGDAAGVRIQPSSAVLPPPRRRTSMSRGGTGRSRRSSGTRPSGWR